MQTVEIQLNKPIYNYIINEINIQEEEEPLLFLAL